MTTPEDRTDLPPVRVRERPRRITFGPNQVPDEPVEELLPSPSESYEFRHAPLPTEIPARVRELARYSKEAAREEVLRWMAPFMMQGATSAQIAAVFGISVKTVPLWRRRYRETLRKEVVARSPIEHYAEAAGRIETYRRYLFSLLVGQSDSQPQQGPNPPGRPPLTKVAIVRTLVDLEKTQLMLNTGYGVAHQHVFERATADGNAVESPAQQLIGAAKEFMGEIASMKDMEGVDLSDLIEELGDGPLLDGDGNIIRDDEEEDDAVR